MCKQHKYYLLNSFHLHVSILVRERTRRNWKTQNDVWITKSSPPFSHTSKVSYLVFRGHSIYRYVYTCIEEYSGEDMFLLRITLLPSIGAVRFGPHVVEVFCHKSACYMWHVLRISALKINKLTFQHVKSLLVCYCNPVRILPVQIHSNCILHGFTL